MKFEIILKGAGVSFAIRVVGVGMAFFMHLLLARAMPQEEYGNYIYILNIVLLLSVLTKFGFSDGGVRFIAQYKSTNDVSRFLGYFLFSTSIVAISNISIIFIIAFLYFYSVDLITSSASQSLIFGIGLLLTISLLQHIQEIFRGCREIILAQIIEQVAAPTVLLLVVTIYYWNGTLVLNSDVILWQALITLLGVMYLYKVFFGKFIAPNKLVIPKYDKKHDWIVVAVPLLLGGLVTVLLSRFDVLVIGYLGNAGEVAGYGVADRMAGLLVFSLAATNAILAPVISELFHKDKIADLQNNISRLMRIVFVITLLAAVVMFVFAEDLLGLFGKEYRSYSSILEILLFAQLINVFFGAVGPLFTMTGHHGIYLKLMGTVCLLNLVLVPVFYHAFSLQGVAYAKIIIIVAWNALLVWIAQKKIGINPMAFPFHRA